MNDFDKLSEFGNDGAVRTLQGLRRYAMVFSVADRNDLDRQVTKELETHLENADSFEVMEITDGIMASIDDAALYIAGVPNGVDAYSRLAERFGKAPLSPATLAKVYAYLSNFWAVNEDLD